MKRLSDIDQKIMLEKLNGLTLNSLYIYDLKEQTVRWTSERASKQFGYGRDQLHGQSLQNLAKLVHPDDIPTLEKNLKDIMDLKDGEILTREYRFLDSKGTYHWIRDRVTVFSRDTEGSPTSFLGLSMSLDEQKTHEDNLKKTMEKLLSSAKMAALGEMAGGIAHEINNPLTVIQARSFQLGQMVDSGKVDPDKIKQAAESISRTADKIARIIKSLRSFAREGAGDPFELVPITQIITETLEFCKTRFYNHGVEIEVEEINPDLEVECRLIQIEQVLLNLLNNSFDAIEKLETKWIRIKALDCDNFVEIHVVDSGTGVPENIINQVMSPFFTTKEVGKGTGLGLSISTGIVRSHQGELFIQRDAPNTTFVIRLPKWQNLEE